MNDEQINNEDDNLYDEEFEDPEEFEDNDSFIDNDEDMELDIPLSFPRFYFYMMIIVIQNIILI